MSAAEFLGEALREHTVVMLATRTCPFCRRASSVLANVTSDVKVYYIDSMPNGNDLFDEVERRYHHSTVPMIFVRGRFVGGCDDLEDIKASGDLAKMLRH